MDQDHGYPYRKLSSWFVPILLVATSLATIGALVWKNSRDRKAQELAEEKKRDEEHQRELRRVKEERENQKDPSDDIVRIYEQVASDYTSTFSVAQVKAGLSRDDLAAVGQYLHDRALHVKYWIVDDNSKVNEFVQYELDPLGNSQARPIEWMDEHIVGIVTSIRDLETGLDEWFVCDGEGARIGRLD